MKIFQTLLLFICLTLAAHAIAAPPTATINLGRIPIGSVRDTIYTLSAGPSPLVINDIRINCNCVKARWDKRPVAPAGSTKIQITFHAKDHGVFYKTIEIRTSDPMKNQQIAIKGTVL